MIKSDSVISERPIITILWDGSFVLNYSQRQMIGAARANTGVMSNKSRRQLNSSLPLFITPSHENPCKFSCLQTGRRHDR